MWSLPCYRKRYHGVMAKVLDCSLLVTKFGYQPLFHFHFHFRINSLGKGINPPYLLSYGSIKTIDALLYMPLMKLNRRGMLTFLHCWGICIVNLVLIWCLCLTAYKPLWVV